MMSCNSRAANCQADYFILASLLSRGTGASACLLVDPLWRAVRDNARVARPTCRHRVGLLRGGVFAFDDRGHRLCSEDASLSPMAGRGRAATSVAGPVRNRRRTKTCGRRVASAAPSRAVWCPRSRKPSLLATLRWELSQFRGSTSWGRSRLSVANGHCRPSRQRCPCHVWAA